MGVIGEIAKADIGTTGLRANVEMEEGAFLEGKFIAAIKEVLTLIHTGRELHLFAMPIVVIVRKAMTV